MSNTDLSGALVPSSSCIRRLFGITTRYQISANFCHFWPNDEEPHSSFIADVHIASTCACNLHSSSCKLKADIESIVAMPDSALLVTYATLGVQALLPIVLGSFQSLKVGSTLQCLRKQKLTSDSRDNPQATETSKDEDARRIRGRR